MTNTGISKTPSRMAVCSPVGFGPDKIVFVNAGKNFGIVVGEKLEYFDGTKSPMFIYDPETQELIGTLGLGVLRVVRVADRYSWTVVTASCWGRLPQVGDTVARPGRYYEDMGL